MIASFPTSIPIGGCIAGDNLHANLAMGSLALKCDPSAPDGIAYDVYMGTECAGEPLPPALVANMADIAYTLSGVQCGGEACPYTTVSRTVGCDGSSTGMKNLYFYFTGDVCAADDFKRECANDVITATPCNGGASTTTASGCNNGNTEIVKCISVEDDATAAPGPQKSKNNDDESSSGTFRGLLTVTLMAFSVAAIAMI